MKALSITQPFATLIAIQAKKFETRSWRTSFRGPLYIHAAKRFPRWAQALVQEEPYKTALVGAYQAGGLPLGWDTCPRGAIIAVADLTGCFPTPGEGVPWREFFGGLGLPPGEPERSFGDYSPGRFAWRLENVRALPEPIPFRGALGLFSVPDLAAQP